MTRGIVLLALACAACGDGGSVVVENVAAAPVVVVNAAPVMPSENVAIDAPELVVVSYGPLNEAELQAYPEARGMPADVQRYLVKRADCEHWAGEEPYDADRRAEIERNVNESCTGLDAQTTQLAIRHADVPAIADMLGKLDPIGM